LTVGTKRPTISAVLGSGPLGQTQLDNQKLIYETLTDNLRSLQSWFDSYDQRAGILLAGASVLIGLLSGAFETRPGPLILMWLAFALGVLVMSVVCGAFVLSSRSFAVPVVLPTEARAPSHPHRAFLVEACINLARAVEGNRRRYRSKRRWYWLQLNMFVFGAIFVAAALITASVSA
jgi:hypothetical protein